MELLQKSPWPDWKIVRLIGQGSFGTVYEIQRVLVDGDAEAAALKVISIPQNSSDIEELYCEGYDDESITSTFHAHLRSIVAEYSLMRKMDGSANVVNCKDICYIQHTDGIGWDICIRMELLTPLMKALPIAVSEDAVIKIGKDICNALVLCKKHEIVHRDIKPQNIFVSPNGDYKLGDFGIAKTVEKTMGGTKIGTYKYMAPEVYNNQPYGSGADIYSLGLVLYWLLNERRMPFMPLPPEKTVAGMEEAARHRRLSGEPLPPPAHGSPELKHIILKACAYNPKDRYASAAAMLEALNRLGSGIVPKAAVAAGCIGSNSNNTTAPFTAVAPAAYAGIPAYNIAAAPIQSPKVTPRPEAAAMKQSAGQPNYVKPAKKSSKRKYILTAIALIAIAILLLLLRSCVGKDAPSDDSQATHTEEWSGWVDKLPANISEDEYEIETRTLYSSRELETTSSTEKSSMPGWELYDTVKAGGDYGPWSNWSSSKVLDSQTRQVQTETRYRYRDKETTTGSSSSKSGWTLYDTTYSWGNYGAWSSWSTSAVSASDSRQVEKKTQYRYRSITYSLEYSDWGSWSAWQTEAVSADDLTQTETRAAYQWYCYYCSNCGAAMPYTTANWEYSQCYTSLGGCGRTSSSYKAPNYAINYLPTTPGSGKYAVANKRYIVADGQKWYINSTAEPTVTQYRYRTRSTYNVPNYGSWSSWGDTAYSDSSTRDVETRTVYRYRDRSQTPTYHFYRWGNWSNWSTSKVTESSNRQVEQDTFYRYRDKATTTTYYFRRWTNWTAYSKNTVQSSENVDVRTKTQYRYKEK